MQRKYVEGIRYRGRKLRELQYITYMGKVYVDKVEQGDNGYWCYTTDKRGSLRINIEEVEIRQVGSSKWERFIEDKARYRVASWGNVIEIYYVAEVNSEVLLGLSGLGVELCRDGNLSEFKPGVWVGQSLVARYENEASCKAGRYYSVNVVVKKRYESFR